MKTFDVQVYYFFSPSPSCVGSWRICTYIYIYTWRNSHRPKNPRTRLAVSDAIMNDNTPSSQSTEVAPPGQDEAPTPAKKTRVVNNRKKITEQKKGSLDDFLSKMSLFEMFFLPIISKYKPDSVNGSVTTKNEIDPEKHGLFVVEKMGSTSKLWTFNESGLPFSVDYGTEPELRKGIEQFMRVWEMTTRKASQMTFAVLKETGGTIYFPLNQKTLEALFSKQTICPMDDDEFLNKVVLGKDSNGKVNRTGKDVKNEALSGDLLFDPLVRGNLLRANNVEVLTNTNVDAARNWHALDIMRRCPLNTRKKFFKSLARNGVISDKNTILYNFCVHGDIVKVSEDIAQVSEEKAKLKPEQITAARDFAKATTKCSLLYWSPGVGKTLGAWACVIEAAKGDKDVNTVGVVFLSSGINLPKTKFVDELLNNKATLGVSVEVIRKEDVKENANYTVGWYWEFDITISETGRKFRIKLLSSNYLRFGVGVSMVKGKDPFFENGKNTFLEPRACDMVLNICDEAHILRGTTVDVLQRGKTDPFLGSDRWEEPSKATRKTSISAYAKGRFVEEDLKMAHEWCSPPKSVAYSKVVWEGLRMENNFYIDDESKSKSKKQKTLLLTATPFGNEPAHFFNILTCGLYASNADDDVDRIQKALTLIQLDQQAHQAQMAALNSAGGSGGDGDDGEVSKHHQSQTSKIARFMEVVELHVLDASNGDGPVTTSSATVDSATAPEQDFSCCHFFVGGGGYIIAPGGTKKRTGGLPWSENGVLENTVLETKTKEEEEQNGIKPSETVFVRARISKRDGDTQRKENRNTIESLLTGAGGFSVWYDDDTVDDGEDVLQDVENITTDNFKDNGILELPRKGTPLRIPMDAITKIYPIHKTRIREVHKLFLDYRDEDGPTQSFGVGISDAYDNLMDMVKTSNLGYCSDDDNYQYDYHDINVDITENPPGLVGMFYVLVEDGEVKPLQLNKLKIDALWDLYANASTRQSARNISPDLTLDMNLTEPQLARLTLDKEMRTLLGVGSTSTPLGENVRSRLRAYSPRYELFFSVLENSIDDVEKRTPVMLFFTEVKGKMLHSLEGFQWYTAIRNRHWKTDYHIDCEPAEFPVYWFLKLKDKSIDDFNVIQDSLEEYAIWLEGDINGSVEAEKEKKTAVLKIVRTELWKFVDKTQLDLGVEGEMETDFIDRPNTHQIVCIVTASESKDWADYLLNERTGLYNHPVNRFGEIVRVIAGADKIGESNDFRNTRHMFFAQPETDVVKLLQKFGRIARSSAKNVYPFYEYGFHKDHLAVDGDNTKYKPIVHYVTLSRPEETVAAFNNIKAKATYYNQYGRLLTRDKTDAKVPLLKPKKNEEWKREALSLRHDTITFQFDDSEYGELSTLRNGLEWLQMAEVFKGGDDDSVVENGLDKLMRNWFEEGYAKDWTYEELKEKTVLYFPIPKKRKKDSADDMVEASDAAANKTLCKYQYGDSTFASGFLPRLMRSVLFRLQSKKKKPVDVDVADDVADADDDDDGGEDDPVVTVSDEPVESVGDDPIRNVVYSVATKAILKDIRESDSKMEKPTDDAIRAWLAKRRESALALKGDQKSLEKNLMKIWNENDPFRAALAKTGVKYALQKNKKAEGHAWEVYYNYEESNDALNEIKKHVKILRDEGSGGGSRTRRELVRGNVGVAEDANQKHRSSMEDRSVVCNPLAPGGGVFLGVFDGHGGADAADFAATHIQQNFANELKKAEHESLTIAEVLTNTYHETDSQMKDIYEWRMWECGCTAVTAYVHVDSQGKRLLHVANTGDSRAVLCRNMISRSGSAYSNIEALTEDHKPSDPEELARIQAAGGDVDRGRVMGVLAVSRALGDFRWKEYVVSTPEVRTTELGSSDEGFILLACDGVFDVFTNEQAVSIIQNSYRECVQAAARSLGVQSLSVEQKSNVDMNIATVLAKNLVERAIQEGSRDNITCLVCLC